MKINFLFYFLFLSFFVLSCSREEDPQILPAEQPLVTKMNVRILSPGSLPFPEADMMYHFTYDSRQRLTKKVGGITYVSGSTGWGGGFFTDKIETNLSYENDKVTVEDLSTAPDFTVPKNTKYFTLNSQSQIAEIEIPNSSFYWYKKQTYSYKNGKLDEIKTTLPNMPFDPADPEDYVITYSERFFYDGSENLIRTEYYELHNGVRAGEKIIRTFGDFDGSYNPFRRFMLLDEFFYRALSKNNFRTYKQERTASYGEFSISEQSWTFNYDVSGNIILN